MTGFDLGDIFTVLPRVAPLWPRIKKAIETVEGIVSDPKAAAAMDEAQAILNDPDVKDVLALVKELSAILQEPPKSPASPDGGIESQR
jgi:hypothetical protein